MEIKGLSYQYIEVDPYKKPEALMEVNPCGLVPELRHGDWSCHESTVLMEYVRTRFLDLIIQIMLIPTLARRFKYRNPPFTSRPQSTGALSSLVRPCQFHRPIIPFSSTQTTTPPNVIPST
jgi:hypothetical protein